MSHIAHVRKNGDQQTLCEHLLGAASLASGNAAKLDLALVGELLGILHDLGKYSAEFQAYLLSAVDLLNQDEDEDYVDAAQMRGKVDHSTAGAQLIWRELSKQGGVSALVGQMLAQCIVSHHSGLIDCLAADGENSFSRRISKNFQRTHLGVVCPLRRIW